MKPEDLVNHLLEDDKPIVLRNKKPASKKNAVYIRVASPEGYEPEGDPSYYGPFDSVASAEETIRKYPAFERVDSGSYDYDDGQTQLTLNVMLALPTGVTAKLPTDFDGEWAWTLQEDKALSATKQKQIRSLQRKADSADVTPGSVDHKVLLKRIKHLKGGGTRRWGEDCNKFIVKGWKEGKVGGYDSVEAAIEDYKAWSGGLTPDEDGLAVIPC